MTAVRRSRGSQSKLSALVAGDLPLDRQLAALEAAGYGIEAAYALTDVEPDLERCLTEGDRLLSVLGRRIAAVHLGGSSENRRKSGQDAQSGVQHIPYGMQ